VGASLERPQAVSTGMADEVDTATLMCRNSLCQADPVAYSGGGGIRTHGTG